jgi:5-(carboxyamino)imidazole ribonucleotide mutase
MNQPISKPMVGIIMGSDSDLPVMQAAADVLAEFAIAFEMTIVSAHRTPKRLYDYADSAVARGLKVIIAGAGGAAHLPGMAAAITPLPVIGVPVKTSALSGQDSLLSIVQMPAGVPVATVAINGAKNAGLLAAQILGSADPTILARVSAFKQQLEAQVLTKVDRMAAGEISAETVARDRAGR